MLEAYRITSNQLKTFLNNEEPASLELVLQDTSVLENDHCYQFCLHDDLFWLPDIGETGMGTSSRKIYSVDGSIHPSITDK